MTARVIVEDLGDIQAILPQKVRYGQEELIILSLHRVVNPNKRRMPLSLEADYGPSGGSSFNRFEDYGVIRLELEVGTNGSEQGVGGHGERSGQEVLRKEEDRIWSQGSQRSELSRVPVTGVEE
tara:strand:- start:359 stop:730 length:372 start_codon:yes stop_codon:yes gene_type:complete